MNILKCKLLIFKCNSQLLKTFNIYHQKWCWCRLSVLRARRRLVSAVRCAVVKWWQHFNKCCGWFVVRCWSHCCHWLLLV